MGICVIQDTELCTTETVVPPTCGLKSRYLKLRGEIRNALSKWRLDMRELYV